MATTTSASLLCAVTLGLLSPGCGDNEGVTPPDASPDDAPPQADAPVEGERLSIRSRPVVPCGGIPDGRLVVVFYQLNDDITVEPMFHIGYDVPFTAQPERIELPLDEVRLPTAIDDYRFCPRSCEDLADPACDCLATEAKVAMALVFVVADLDGSGMIELEEVDTPNIYGIGYFMLGASDQAYPAPNMLDLMFIEGIEEGLRPYRIVPPTPPSPFDQLGVPAPGTVFELDLCVPGAPSCSMLRFPNVT